MALSKDRREELLEEWGPDPLEDGDCLRFKKQFNASRPPYTYVGLRAGGKYFITGSTEQYYWLELCDFVEEDNLLEAEFDAVEESDWTSDPE